MWPAGATSTRASTTRSPASCTTRPDAGRWSYRSASRCSRDRMPVKTRSRSRARPTSYRPRRPAPRRGAARGPGLKLPIAPGQSLLPWLAVGVVAALAVSMVWLAPQIVDAFEAVLRLFGIGLALLVTAAVLDVRTAFRRSLSLDRTFLRVWAGLHLLLLTAFGLLGFYKPGWHVGGVSFAEVSAGGDAGLLWPPLARAAGRASLALLRGLVSMELPQRAGEALRSFFTALLPENADEDEEGTEGEPYVSNLDEEWGRPAGRGWELPPIDLLTETAEEDIRPVDNEARAQLIVDTLASFGVNTKVVSINQGPTVTQFGVEPGWETKTRTVMVRDEKGKPVYDKDGKPQYRTEVVSRTRVRVNRITALANDLTLALAAPTIRIEAPVPGRGQRQVVR